MLGKTFGRDHTYTNRAMQERLPPEQAGESMRAIGELTLLPTKESREIFREAINWPE